MLFHHSMTGWSYYLRALYDHLVILSIKNKQAEAKSACLKPRTGKQQEIREYYTKGVGVEIKLPPSGLGWPQKYKNPNDFKYYTNRWDLKLCLFRLNYNIVFTGYPNI
ncbi:MAG: hypothetical protein ABFD08_08215, partial [Syntrophomonas sp.]